MASPSGINSSARDRSPIASPCALVAWWDRSRAEPTSRGPEPGDPQSLIGRHPAASSDSGSGTSPLPGPGPSRENDDRHFGPVHRYSTPAPAELAPRDVPAPERPDAQRSAHPGPGGALLKRAAALAWVCDASPHPWRARRACTTTSTITSRSCLATARRGDDRDRPARDHVTRLRLLMDPRATPTSTAMGASRSRGDR